MNARRHLSVLVLFATNNIGGPGKGLFQLIESCDPATVRFTVCNFRHPEQESFEFLDAAKERGIDIRLIVQRWPLDVSMVRQALDFARSDTFDVVQSHGYKTHILASVVSKRLGIPWLALSHGWTAENLKIRVYNAIERHYLRRADSAVGVSPALYSEARQLRGQRRTQMILNAIPERPPVESGIREAVREELGISGDSVLLGVFGRLSHEKGQDLFIEAMSRVKGDANVVAVLLGEGLARDRLLEQRDRLGLADRVRFLGYTAEIDRYYAAVDLCVLPSRSEGLPNVVLEAQQAGAPVIAFDVGGVSETIVDGETGWLVTPGDVDALASRIENLAARMDERRRVAAAAKTALFPKFSVGRRRDAFLDEYRYLVADHGEEPS